jgi:peroxiredoxin
VGLLEVAVLLAWLAIVLCLWAAYQLVAQNGRLLLRVEALERQLGDLVGLTFAPTSLGSDDEHELGTDYGIPEDEAPAGAPGIPVGTVLHDFELPDLDGRQHLRSQMLGQRLLMIFVSPYCRHSRALLSDLAALRAAPSPTWPTPLVVSTGSIEENRRLVERAGITSPILMQEEMEVGALFEVPATPMAYLIGEDGRTASPLIAGRVAVLGFAACSTSGDDASLVESPSPELLFAVTTPAPVNGARYRGGLDVGSVAPSFDLPGLNGRTVALDQFRGKPLLVVFTDPVSPSCDELVPHLAELHRSGSGPAIVLIGRGDLEANQTWAVKHGLTLPIGVQRGWDVSREYGLLAAPIAYLVDERGTIAAPVAIGADAILDLYRAEEGVQTGSDATA